jgi:hypothetical protein
MAPMRRTRQQRSRFDEMEQQKKWKRRPKQNEILLDGQRRLYEKKRKTESTTKNDDRCSNQNH